MKQAPRYRESGFTLVELMIVLVVVAIVASISVVGAIAMRVQTNESLVRSSLKAIATGCESYRVNQTVYPSDLSALGVDYLGGGFDNGEKSGYQFGLVSGNDGETFTSTAVPKAINYSGIKSYCLTQSGLILAYTASPSLAADGTECPTGGVPVQ